MYEEDDTSRRVSMMGGGKAGISKERALELALQWALENIRHRGDSVCGIFCRFCKGGVKKEDYKGMVNDKITHTTGCPWIHANGLIGRNSSET